MEEELRELKELVAQLKADNERLRQEQAVALPGSSTTSSNADRKCPKFNGRSGTGINEWIEEAQACIRARYLSISEQAFFLFDHLEGEAREEIRKRFLQRHLEGESLLEFSLALMGLMEKIKQRFLGPCQMLWYYYVSSLLNVANNALWRELKQLVRRQPTAMLLEVRRLGGRVPGGVRARSQSVPLSYGIQYGVQG
ncbi:Protein TIC 214 [Labeo rohita]|uniref:Protein TIC 214 n=1 Tax=Labeo rohita TaxID=84645 RepID=A0ABQ8MB34_LABRO|nr:Protein TIC 214 [Labeo rohita]